MMCLYSAKHTPNLEVDHESAAWFPPMLWLAVQLSKVPSGFRKLQCRATSPMSADYTVFRRFFPLEVLGYSNHIKQTQQGGMQILGGKNNGKGQNLVLKIHLICRKSPALKLCNLWYVHILGYHFHHTSGSYRSDQQHLQELSGGSQITLKLPTSPGAQHAPLGKLGG